MRTDAGLVDRHEDGPPALADVLHGVHHNDGRPRIQSCTLGSRSPFAEIWRGSSIVNAYCPAGWLIRCTLP